MNLYYNISPEQYFLRWHKDRQKINLMNWYMNSGKCLENWVIFQSLSLDRWFGSDTLSTWNHHEPSGEGRHLHSRRQDMMYCCTVLLRKAQCFSLQHINTMCMAPLFNPKLFVIFQFCARLVLKTSPSVQTCRQTRYLTLISRSADVVSNISQTDLIPGNENWSPPSITNGAHDNILAELTISW